MRRGRPVVAPYSPASPPRRRSTSASSPNISLTKGPAPTALEYAFAELGVELMTVFHYPWNERSRRVIERLGFRPEGLRRMAGRNYDGRIEDEMAYSMTRAEFFAGRG